METAEDRSRPASSGGRMRPVLDRIRAKARLWLALGAMLAGLFAVSIPGFIVVVAVQFILWWWSGPIAVRAFGATESSPIEHPRLHRFVDLLAEDAGIPTPRLYTSSMGGSLNAAASGRSPRHAVVLVSDALLASASDRQLRGVLAHELGHVANRDAAITTVVAVLSYVLILLAYLVGHADDEHPSPGFLMFAVVGAALLQAAVSRQRELAADKFGAVLARDPDGLGDALEMLERRSAGMSAAMNPALSSLQTAGPGKGEGSGEVLRALFATHPPTKKRVDRLRRLRDSGESDRQYPALI